MRPPAVNAALEEAVRADPDSDDLRRVYADWLDDNGDPYRAEFIRVQLELPALSLSDPRRRALEVRQDDLLAAHEEAWLGVIPARLEECRFERGFVGSVAVQGTTDLTEVAGLFERHPITRVERWAVMGLADEIIDSPYLERLHGLILDDPMDVGSTEPEQVEVVLTSPRLAGLRELSVWGSLAREVAFGLPLRRPGNENLRTLRLDDLSDRQARHLATSPAFSRVEALECCPGEALTGRGFAALLAGPGRWTCLGPGFADLTASALARVSRCHRLDRLKCNWPAGETRALPLPSQLRRLELYGRESPSLATLARLRCLPALEELPARLELTAEESANAPRWADLERLLKRLSGPALRLTIAGDGRLAPLARLAGLEHIRELRLDPERLTAEHIEALAGCAGLAGLRRLQFPLGRGTPSLASLAKAPLLTNLEEWFLGSCGVDDQGLRQLLDGPGLRRLKILWLHGNRFGAAGVEALANWPGLARLRELHLNDNPLDASAFGPLQRAPRLSPLLRLSVSESDGERRLRRADLQPLQDRLGERLSVTERY